MMLELTILSSEGINGTIAGKKDNINKIIKILKKYLNLMILIAKICLKVFLNLLTGVK